MSEYSAQRVRSRTRAAVRKREEQIEVDEMESGELNLIPYLDMVTNLMLFILASVAGGLILSQIDTTLPERRMAPPAAPSPGTNPDDQPLGLHVTINTKEMILWSTSKLEGTVNNPKPGYIFPRISLTNNTPCDAPSMCESTVCSAGVCQASDEMPQPVYPYRKLNDVLFEIAKRRYKDKKRKADTYTITLMADASIPYSVVVSVMNAMRCRLPEFGQQAKVTCLMPNEDPEFKKSSTPVDGEQGYFNTETVNYDPEWVDPKSDPAAKRPRGMALFPQIQFSTGFQTGS